MSNIALYPTTIWTPPQPSPSPNSATATPPPQLPLFERVSICYHFVSKGTCVRGDKCVYLHINAKDLLKENYHLKNDKVAAAKIQTSLETQNKGLIEQNEAQALEIIKLKAAIDTVVHETTPLKAQIGHLGTALYFANERIKFLEPALHFANEKIQILEAEKQRIEQRMITIKKAQESLAKSMIKCRKRIKNLSETIK